MTDSLPMGNDGVAAGSWFVYILLCADGTFYTGVTTDLARRTVEHNTSALGARYTRSRRPVTLVYFEAAVGRSEAARREAEIKKLSRGDKAALVAAHERCRRKGSEGHSGECP